VIFFVSSGINFVVDIVLFRCVRLVDNIVDLYIYIYIYTTISCCKSLFKVGSGQASFTFQVALFLHISIILLFVCLAFPFLLSLRPINDRWSLSILFSLIEIMCNVLSFISLYTFRCEFNITCFSFWWTYVIVLYCYDHGWLVCYQYQFNFNHWKKLGLAWQVSLQNIQPGGRRLKDVKVKLIIKWKRRKNIILYQWHGCRGFLFFIFGLLLFVCFDFISSQNKPICWIELF